MLEGLHVDYYGSMMPLNQVSNVSVPDARTLMIQPWEKSMVAPIEKAILAANLGFNPQNDGTVKGAGTHDKHTNQFTAATASMGTPSRSSTV